MKTIKAGASFDDGFKLEFCDGINVLIGENGVGKTTILKMIYAATGYIFCIQNRFFLSYL